ncbi:MAG: hypothetical protein GF418_02925 [Chitinivibrionales bacterium]|nr:hypothetical protein [Chitinivibrionales bacterium]MBD3394555.1 hypothetical protein [Chitinivibrionales bacterium]
MKGSIFLAEAAVLSLSIISCGGGKQPAQRDPAPESVIVEHVTDSPPSGPASNQPMKPAAPQPASERIGKTVVPLHSATGARTPAAALPPSRQAAPNGDLVVEARLVEIPGTFPPNELYNYVYVMKYRVLEVAEGSYERDEILVGHYNPLIPRDRIKDNMRAYVTGNVQGFAEGDKHRLVLTTPLEKVWKEAVEDEYFDEPGEKFFALRADKAK